MQLFFSTILASTAQKFIHLILSIVSTQTPFYEISWPLHISFPIFEQVSDSLHLLIKSTDFPL